MAADLLSAAVVERRRTGVMGTDLQVLVRGGQPGPILGAVDRHLQRLERRWSRFLPTSDVTLLNGAGGRPYEVTLDTALLVSRALAAHTATGGLFDPAVLQAVVAAGYDRPYARVDPASPPLRPPASLPRRTPLAGAYVEGATVTLPPGAGFDPGGIGKGLAADLVAATAIGMGATGVLINLGGDVRVDGDGPDGGWPVVVADPFDDGRVMARLAVAAGAVATSSRTRRRLGRGHHLIDPATGAPAASGLAQTTVLAAEAWWAEALATAAFIAGPVAGVELLDRHGVSGLLVTDDGELVGAGDIVSFLC